MTAAAMAAMPRAKRFLQPGHLIVSAEPVEVTTILGSCVAVCLWDATLRIGGINHFMLPQATGNAPSSARFGDTAMKQLVADLAAAGARTPFLQARVYGGACLFAGARLDVHLGQKNVEVALTFLARIGTKVIEVQTGGSRGRKLIYRTDEGSVCLTSI